MKKTTIALALLLSLGFAAGLAQDAEKKTTPVRTLSVPSMKAHKDLESHRVALAKHVAAHTVSIEIDFDREDVGGGGPTIPGIPGMGPDMSDPFFRYDIGPFSGLVVGPNHILISDRCLGEFSEDGPSDAVEAITATLPNGERWPARVIGRHQQIDLALLELDCVINETCPELNVFELPTGKVELERGTDVLVVGRGQNPLGALVNDGIVSALEREGGRAFQLDARIGNSTLGAPVADNNGTLVGIVTYHNHQQFGQASGVSYAAYIHDVREAYDAMKEGAFIPRPPSPFMGIGAAPKWPDKPGLEIGNVVPGTGAEKAGLQIGDIILQVNETDMFAQEDLIKVINEHNVGDTLKVKILRGENERTVEVTLGARP